MIKSTLSICASLLQNNETKNLLKAEDTSTFLVLPWHLDLNLHVNNAHYFKYCNQARLEFLAKHGFLKKLLINRIIPIIYKNEMEYKKSLKIFQLFKVITSIESINKLKITLIHRFEKDGIHYGTCKTYAKLISKKAIDSEKLFKDISNE
ncbi:MAG: YbgC/YbaW family acyl-CoA thioester hydrolase [Thermoproteota archaeon]|jgi:YbgC/YbaW family acyl-CoA thioester hydrolase